MSFQDQLNEATRKAFVEKMVKDICKPLWLPLPPPRRLTFKEKVAVRLRALKDAWDVLRGNAYATRWEDE